MYTHSISIVEVALCLKALLTFFWLLCHLGDSCWLCLNNNVQYLLYVFLTSQMWSQKIPVVLLFCRFLTTLTGSEFTLAGLQSPSSTTDMFSFRVWWLYMDSNQSLSPVTSEHLFFLFTDKKKRVEQLANWPNAPLLVCVVRRNPETLRIKLEIVKKWLKIFWKQSCKFDRKLQQIMMKKSKTLCDNVPVIKPRKVQKFVLVKLMTLFSKSKNKKQKTR